MEVVAVTALLSTRKLSRSFSGLRAVHEVDFDLPKGEIRALIGPNGAGKSTFVNLLIGREKPSAGNIFFDGQDITQLAAHKRVAQGIAYTFQITSVFLNLSLGENVALAARRRLKRNKPAVAAEVADALARVGLADRVSQLASDLSYGHQRLLEIAMGLAQSPRLMILDEPTQGLAENEIAEFKHLIRSLVPHTTILLIEHNMNVVMEIADRISVLNFGKILAQGTPSEIHNNELVQAAYLGTG